MYSAILHPVALRLSAWRRRLAYDGTTRDSLRHGQTQFTTTFGPDPSAPRRARESTKNGARQHDPCARFQL